MNDFVIEMMVNKLSSDEKPFMVMQMSTGWFYPNLSKMEAEMLCDKFNEVNNSN